MDNESLRTLQHEHSVGGLLDMEELMKREKDLKRRLSNALDDDKDYIFIYKSEYVKLLPVINFDNVIEHTYDGNHVYVYFRNLSKYKINIFKECLQNCIVTILRFILSPAFVCIAFVLWLIWTIITSQ